MYRKTFVEVNLDNISNNVKNIIKKYPDYKYYIGMVKSNAYGHGYYIVNTLIEAGINYLAVSSLDEALKIREYNKDIPVLITEIIDDDLTSIAIKNNITLTIDNLEYLKNIGNKKCTIHLKLDTIMNRIGIKTKSEFNEIYKYIEENKNIYLEGIYTHFATPGVNDIYYDLQIKNFKNITSDIDLSKIPIVHLSSSFALLNHPKIEFANAVRIGTILYGYDISLKDYSNDFKSKLKKARDKFLTSKYDISKVIRGTSIDLKPAFKIKTNVMEIKDVKKGELLGYGTNIMEEDAKVAILPIGYESGIGTNNIGRRVLINNKHYDVIGPTSMCMMFVRVDDSVKVKDEVTILGDSITLGQISRLNNSHIQLTLVTIGANLPRVYIKNNKVEKEL